MIFSKASVRAGILFAIILISVLGIYILKAFGMNGTGFHQVATKSEGGAVTGWATGRQLSSTPRRPICDNILQNLTKGRWVRKVELPHYRDQIEKWKQKELELDLELQKFRLKRGIQVKFWREDDRCGRNNLAERPSNSQWPEVGSWCNAHGEKPCCSDANNGICMRPSEETCNCSSCVDVRKYVHADASDWIVDDPKCHWRNYSASETCDVIEQSPFSDIHFVGDSFIRKMFLSFAMLVTADTVHGAVSRSTPLHLRKLCKENDQFYWVECRETLFNVSETWNTSRLCGGRGSINFSVMYEFYNNNLFKDQFLELVKCKLGKPGSLIILGVGGHMNCISKDVIGPYLGPAVEAIEKYYGNPPGPILPTHLSGRWPQIIYSPPLTTGLLKSRKYIMRQNNPKCSKFSREMMEYAKEHDIRVLNFRPLTAFVDSFDGTHHALVVNTMKNQILLNFIASIKSG